MGLTSLIYRVGKLVARLERCEQDVTWFKGLFDRLAEERVIAMLGDSKLKRNSPLSVSLSVPFPRTVADTLDSIRPTVLNGLGDIENLGYFRTMAEISRYISPEDVVLVMRISSLDSIADARVLIMCYLNGGGGTLVDPEPDITAQPY